MIPAWCGIIWSGQEGTIPTKIDGAAWGKIEIVRQAANGNHRR
jgi:hypothetical protein